MVIRQSKRTPPPPEGWAFTLPYHPERCTMIYQDNGCLAAEALKSRHLHSRP